MSQAADYAPLVVKVGTARSCGSPTWPASSTASPIRGSPPGTASSRRSCSTITKEAGANVIETVDRIQAVLPQLMEWMPPDIQVTVMSDRTTTIRASVTDVQTRC